MGSQDEFNLTVIRNAAAHAVKAARKHKAEHVATIVHGAGIGGIDTTAAAEATVEGTLLGLYRYAKPLRRPKTDHEIATITVVELFADKLDAIRDGVRTAQAIADGVILTRDLVKQPANIVSPQHLAGIAKQIADEYDIDITVGGRKWMRKHKMGALLAVAQGQGKSHALLSWITIAIWTRRRSFLSAKGITFDSGGITIKPGANMGAMKAIWLLLRLCWVWPK